MTLQETVMAGFSAYQAAAQAHPWLTNMATATAIFTSSDVAAQVIENRSKPAEERTIDMRRTAYTAALAPVYGAGLQLLVESAEIPASIGLDAPLEKAALGPNLWGNAFNGFLYLNNAVGKASNYSLQTLAQHYTNILSTRGEKPTSWKEGWMNFKQNTIGMINRNEYMKSVLGAVTFWNGVHYANFTIMPEELRTPIAIGASLPWVLALTLWSTRNVNKKTPDI